MQAIAVHGRTRAQGYSGEADWDVIDACSRAVSIPVIGNGDIQSGMDVERRRKSTGVSGVMIGRAAMQYPWIFRDAKRYLESGIHPEPVSCEERWDLILRHARLLIEWGKFPTERHAMQALRSRLMAYSKGLRHGKILRGRFSVVNSVPELEDIAADYLAATFDGIEAIAAAASA